MSESLEDLKAIIDNAPDGATHVCFDGGEPTYWSEDITDAMDSYGSYVGVDGMRSLSDIKRIIELMEWQQSAFDAHPNIDIDMERGL